MRALVNVRRVMMDKLLGGVLMSAICVIALTGGAGLLFAQEAFAIEPICPGGASPDPNVMFCDDFEDGTGLDTWGSSPWCCDKNGDGIVSVAETEFVICGSSGFQDNCAAWTDGYQYGQHYAQRPFLSVGTDELYARWYIYISTPFRWDPTGDKNFMLRDPLGGTFIPYIVINLWATGKPHIIVYNNASTPCVNQSTPDPNGEYHNCVNRYQNTGNDMTFQPGRWYLLEWYVKLNSPGMANGVSKLWVDDASVPISTQTLRASYTDIVFRTSGDGLRLLTDIMLTAYANDRPNALPEQFVRWDKIVVSRTPIGPTGSASAPPQVPQAPTGLTVR